MTRLRPLLIACSLSQVSCAPIVYELDGHTTVEPPPPTTVEPPPPTTDEPTTGDSTTGDSTTETASTEPAPAPACDDGLWNGEESDLDCGGPCSPCAPGQRCTEPLDCSEQVCDEGVCGWPSCKEPRSCPPPGPCRRWECDPRNGCASVPDFDVDGQPCFADDPCIFAGLCKQGECVGPTVDCSEFDGPCRASACNPNSGNCEIQWIAEGESCDDGIDCTFGEQCMQGACVAMKPGKPLFNTDFSEPIEWFVEPPWQIGAAQPSKCADKLGDDPSTDHSPSFDEMLAGAIIGDCLPPLGFPPGCLTSPPLDVQDFPGELWLRYWSVLNSGGPPMESHIDVFNEQLGWVPLTKEPEFTMEPDWTEHIIDLTPFIGPGLQIRFCHSAFGDIPPAGGWSLDDISIGPPTCE